MSNYMESLGRYGATPFIASLYGFGEFCQAFCRLGAVYGGTYMLRTQPKNLIVDKAQNKFVGVCDGNDRQFKANFFVCSSGFMPQFIDSTQSR